jgi:hypothetical protein
MTNPAIKAKALLDTGSLPGNFITVDLLKRIKGSDCLYKTDQPIRVCSGLDNHCIDSSDVVDVLVSFKVKNKYFSIPLTCRISLSGPVDLIIGRDSIKKHWFLFYQTSSSMKFWKIMKGTFLPIATQSVQQIPVGVTLMRRLQP